MFPFLLEISSSQLTNSIIFQRGGPSTNQYHNLCIFKWTSPSAFSKTGAPMDWIISSLESGDGLDFCRWGCVSLDIFRSLIYIYISPTWGLHLQSIEIWGFFSIFWDQTKYRIQQLGNSFRIQHPGSLRGPSETSPVDDLDSAPYKSATSSTAPVPALICTDSQCGSAGSACCIVNVFLFKHGSNSDTFDIRLHGLHGLTHVCWSYLHNVTKWIFPKIGVPTNHPFQCFFSYEPLILFGILSFHGFRRPFSSETASIFKALAEAMPFGLFTKAWDSGWRCNDG